jgi:putative oxidoreductase
VTALFSSRTPPGLTDVALIAARATLGFLFIYHGGRRLFGWFGGAGLDASATFFAHTAGLEPGKFFAVLSGITELGGGIAIAIGLFARLAGLAIFGDMMIAIVTVEWAHGLNSTGGNEGYELNLALGVLALVIGILGAGRVSVDALIERRLTEGTSPPS